MTRVLLALLISAFCAPAAIAEARSPGVFTVTAEVLNVRLAANKSGTVSGKLRRGQEVEVIEVVDGWARISGYLDGESGGQSAEVARWVFAAHLAAKPGLTDNTGTGSPAVTNVETSAATAVANPPAMFTVNAGSLNVRLAAARSGKVAGKLRRGQEVEVFEVVDGWARISEYYDGAVDGQPGRVARWVSSTHLSAGLPRRKQVDTDSPVARAIEASDDLEKHLHTFVWASEKLVNSGECDLSDFKDIGGWWRSAAHKPRSVYYTYCGGATNSHRIYLDTSTGQTFR